MADSTSLSAPWMSRSRSKIRMMRALPSELCEVISSTPAMALRCRSSGVVTLVATVSGLAPGSCAMTTMAGKSTVGMDPSGKRKYAASPTSATPIDSSVVATGLRTKGREMFIPAGASAQSRGLRRQARGPAVPSLTNARPLPHTLRETVEEEIDDRGGEERQQLADEQPADDGETEWRAQLRARAGAEHQRQGREERRHGGHQDRPEAQQRRLVDRLLRR